MVFVFIVHLLNISRSIRYADGAVVGKMLNCWESKIYASILMEVNYYGGKVALAMYTKYFRWIKSPSSVSKTWTKYKKWKIVKGKHSCR